MRCRLERWSNAPETDRYGDIGPVRDMNAAIIPIGDCCFFFPSPRCQTMWADFGNFQKRTYFVGLVPNTQYKPLSYNRNRLAAYRLSIQMTSHNEGSAWKLQPGKIWRHWDCTKENRKRYQSQVRWDRYGWECPRPWEVICIMKWPRLNLPVS